VYIHEQEFGLRDPLAACYRALRDGGGAAGRDLEPVLRGAAPRPRSPELAGRLLAVLTEVGLVELDRERAAARTTARPRATLEESSAYRAYRQRHEDGLRYLGSRIRQAA
jgi:single-stranded-DNA-specific exonuclease